MKSITSLFSERFAKKQKIALVTCYDYTFARLLNDSEADCLLVGDSLGMVIQGNDSTLPVTLDDMIYHCRAVRRGAPDKMVICDMPFLSYQVSVESALVNAGRILAEGNCHAVKIEGHTEHNLAVIRKLSENGIPVMGHIGLTPQSVHTLGGYRVQGKTEDSGMQLVKAATEMEKAGVFSLLLELIPAGLGEMISNTVGVPTIGIGAGNQTHGQVLVLYDLLGLNPGFHPRHLKKYAELGQQTIQAINEYAREVGNGKFPSAENSF